MFMVWSAPCVDNSPKLSDIKDGKQTIEVYDKKLGGMRKVTTTPDKIDDFLKNGCEEDKEVIKKGGKNSLKCILAGATLGILSSLIKKKPCLKGATNNALFGVLIGAIVGLGNLAIKRNVAANDRIQNFIENNK